jgi:hypothetical protein
MTVKENELVICIFTGRDRKSRAEAGDCSFSARAGCCNFGRAARASIRGQYGHFRFTLRPFLISCWG